MAIVATDYQNKVNSYYQATFGRQATVASSAAVAWRPLVARLQQLNWLLVNKICWITVAAFGRGIFSRI